MTLTLTGSSRRILTFPAVHPCESIAVKTLIDSLLQIAGEILSYKPKHFSTNKGSIHQTLRHVQNLVIFFEEIRIRIRIGLPGRSFPDKAVMSLSELHVIFQKLKFLLEDCTRDGAQLYMLMRSNQVSGHFRVLTRSISICLDTFPLESVDLSEEVNELIGLVMRQTRKYGARPDPEDKRAINLVYRIFTLFENRVNPNSDEILRVLDQIGVRNWSDCVKQVDFIEEEIEEEKKKNSNARIELLTSLVGLLGYSRCVTLRDFDDDDDDEKEEENFLRSVSVDDLRCPISLELMMDPVILETGHTYDRSSITKWFSSGNITCPKTGKTLTSTVLVDNVSVKRVVQSYCKQNGVVLTEATGQKRKKKSVMPESLAAEGAVTLIADFIVGELVNGGEEKVFRAVKEIRVLTKTDSYNRSCLVEAGVVDPLLKILHSGEPRLQENAMAGIMNLSKHISGKNRIAGDGKGLGIIVEVLNEGARIETRQYAAAALFYLSSVEDYSKLIGEISDAIPGLVRIVKGCDYGDSGKRNALIAIRGLLMQQPENYWQVLAAGAVPALLDLIKSGEMSDGLMTDSTAILAKLAEYTDGTISVIRRGGLKQAINVLGLPEVSPAAKQHCVALLLNLCYNGGRDVVEALAKNPSIMGSLYTVLSNGEYGGGKKASTLIRMIHDFQESKTNAVEPVFERDRFIHAW